MAKAPFAPPSLTRPATLPIVRALAARLSQCLRCRWQRASLQQQQGLQGLHLQGKSRTLRTCSAFTCCHWCQRHRTYTCFCRTACCAPFRNSMANRSYLLPGSQIDNRGVKPSPDPPPLSSFVCAGGRLWLRQGHEWAPDSPHKELWHSHARSARAADAWQAHKGEPAAQGSGALHLTFCLDMGTGTDVLKALCLS